MLTSLLSTITKASSTGVSLLDIYEFHPDVLAELELHPRDHSHLSDEVFAEQMKAIPQTKLQAVTTACDDPALTANLRGVSRIKFNEWIPKQERQWSNQLRISAYLYDMLLRLRESDEFEGVVQQCPEFEDIFLTAKFSFLSCTTMRRKLANERVRILGEAAGPEFLLALKDRDQIKDMQSRELLDDSDTKALSNALKRQKVIKKALPTHHNNNGQDKRHQRQVFGRGRGRGHSFPRHTSTGQSNNRGRSQQFHQHRKWVRDPSQQQQQQQQQQQHQQQGSKFAGRGRGRHHYQQQQSPSA
jgi:hypothetical protein